MACRNVAVSTPIRFAYGLSAAFPSAYAWKVPRTSEAGVRGRDADSIHSVSTGHLRCADHHEPRLLVRIGESIEPVREANDRDIQPEEVLNDFGQITPPTRIDPAASCEIPS